jgi:hypothetical protein
MYLTGVCGLSSSDLCPASASWLGPELETLKILSNLNSVAHLPDNVESMELLLVCAPDHREGRAEGKEN